MFCISLRVRILRCIDRPIAEWQVSRQRFSVADDVKRLYDCLLYCLVCVCHIFIKEPAAGGNGNQLSGFSNAMSK